ncbi:MAG: type II secretion system F family protein [Candidatus Acidiferrales bacterium]|jgi:tight adherence protein B
MALFAALITFILILGIAGAVLFATRGDSESEAVERRLQDVSAGTAGVQQVNKSMLRDSKVSDLPALNRLLLSWSGLAKFNAYIAQAGMKIKPGVLALLSAICGVAIYFFCYVEEWGIISAVLFGLLGFALPLMFVAFRRRQRLRKFEKNFPEAIDLLSRAIRAGHAVTAGLEMMSKETPQPVGGEFRIVFEENNFGLPLRDALHNLTERIPLVDVRFFVTGLVVQKETGGNLVELLENLASVIRERFKIRGEVRTKTAQGRFTAAILIALPPTFLLITRAVNPEYTHVLFADPLGRTMLGVGAFLQILGSLIIWKIVNIEV